MIYGDVQMRMLTTRASLIVFLLLVFPLISTCFAHLRVGAFNIRVFGKSKVADRDVLDILVKVSERLCEYRPISRGGTGTRRLPGSGRVLHYPALPGPGRVLL